MTTAITIWKRFLVVIMRRPSLETLASLSLRDIYLFIYRFVQCTRERTIGHVIPYLAHPPNPIKWEIGPSLSCLMPNFT